MGDSVLERNLCFVDTPGYGNQTSVSDAAPCFRSCANDLVLGMHNSSY